jgi:hypothetical protein
MNTLALVPLVLFACPAGFARAADVSTHVLGAKKQALSAGTDTVNAGYYAAKNLSDVDTDLAAGNIAVSTTIFGITGTFLNPPSSPTVGGTWLLVPGSASLGTGDFYVMKYEAKNVGGTPTSQPSGAPWVSITQTQALSSCAALGAGYHLLTMPEAQTISRNIESNGWNWTGGSVGSGGLWRGHSDNSPANPLAADVTGDPDDDPYVGTGNVTPSIEKRVHQLSSGQYVWDWSANVFEWLDMTCTAGSGVGNWYNSGNWVEWTNANLSDYEKVRAGPSGAYTTAQNMGQYYGCNAAGKAAARGCSWDESGNAGVFALYSVQLPSYSDAYIGFRCGK